MIIELGSYAKPIKVNASVELIEVETDEDSVNELDAPEESREPMASEAETQEAEEAETTQN